MTRSALTQAVALAFLTLPGLALAAAPAPPPEAPRALSEAERQAVVLAAEYLDQGPAAWWNRLARTSPLRRLGREAALAEIEVRAGAPAGAEWALEAAPREIRGAVFTLGFPSGVDDTLVLDLVQENGGLEDRLAADRRRAGGGETAGRGDRGDGRDRREDRRRRSGAPFRAGAAGAVAGQDPRLAAPGRRGRRRPAPGRRPCSSGISGRWRFRWGSPAASSWRAPWPPRSCPACWRRDRWRWRGAEIRASPSCARCCRSGAPSPRRRGRCRRPCRRRPGRPASPARSPSSGGPRTCSAGWTCAASTRC